MFHPSSVVTSPKANSMLGLIARRGRGHGVSVPNTSREIISGLSTAPAITPARNLLACRSI
jgi:hypothetical protein